MKKKVSSKKWYWWNCSCANFQIFHMQGAPAKVKSCAKRSQSLEVNQCEVKQPWNMTPSNLQDSEQRPARWASWASIRILWPWRIPWRMQLASGRVFQNLKGITVTTMWQDCIKKNFKLKPRHLKMKSKTWSFHLPQNLLQNPGHVNLYLPPRSGATVEICIFPQLSCRLKFHIHGWRMNSSMVINSGYIIYRVSLKNGGGFSFLGILSRIHCLLKSK